MSITIVPGSLGSQRDGNVRPAVWVGIVIVGLSVAVGLFIQAQSQDPSPPEDIPRAIAIPALYATMGLLAVVGALQRRPAIVVAAGLLCIGGALLSIATIEFVVPGIILIALGARLEGRPGRRRREALIAGVAAVLVVSAGIALLSMTEGRCWEAAGSPAKPIYTVIPCGGETVIPSGGSTYASGFDSADLTVRGGVSEAVLLLGALGLAALTGRGSGTRLVAPAG
jgi:hypothetical protein